MRVLTAAAAAKAETPISTAAYPKRTYSVPASVVATDAASALMNIVKPAAVLRSGSGVSFMSRLYNAGELIHWAAEKAR